MISLNFLGKLMLPTGSYLVWGGACMETCTGWSPGLASEGGRGDASLGVCPQWLIDIDRKHTSNTPENVVINTSNKYVVKPSSHLSTLPSMLRCKPATITAQCVANIVITCSAYINTTNKILYNFQTIRLLFAKYHWGNFNAVTFSSTHLAVIGIRLSLG